jgi:hypothetical protein
MTSTDIGSNSQALMGQITTEASSAPGRPPDSASAFLPNKDLYDTPPSLARNNTKKSNEKKQKMGLVFSSGEMSAGEVSGEEHAAAVDSEVSPGFAAPKKQVKPKIKVVVKKKTQSQAEKAKKQDSPPSPEVPSQRKAAATSLGRSPQPEIYGLTTPQPNKRSDEGSARPSAASNRSDASGLETSNLGSPGEKLTSPHPPSGNGIRVLKPGEVASDLQQPVTPDSLHRDNGVLPYNLPPTLAKPPKQPQSSVRNISETVVAREWDGVHVPETQLIQKAKDKKLRHGGTPSLLTVAARVATMLEQEVKNRKPELQFIRDCLLGDSNTLCRPHDFHESHWLGVGVPPRHWPGPGNDKRNLGESRAEASKALMQNGWSFGQLDTETVKPQSEHRNSEGGRGNQEPNGNAKPMKPTVTTAFSVEEDLNLDPEELAKDWILLPLRGPLRARRAHATSAASSSAGPMPRWPTTDDVKKGQLETMLSTSGTWNFNTLEFAKHTDSQTLQFIAWEALTCGNCVAEFSINSGKIKNFLHEVEMTYLVKAMQTFHNNIHAADVTQALHAMLTECVVGIFYDPMDVLGSIIAASVHDLGDDGRTNNFHIAIQDELALVYNDYCVLQNFSVAQVFKMFKDTPRTDFMADLAPAQTRMLRREVISMVLNTDTACHYHLRGSFDRYLCRCGQDPGAWHSDEAAMDTLRGSVLHMADHSFLARTSNQASDWLERLKLELFSQGDEELAMGLPVSPLCDRNAPHQKSITIGLLDFMARPLLISMARLPPKLADIPLKNLEKNKEMWRRITEESEYNLI